MTPSGTAVETARISVQIDSASVGSRRWAISSVTVFLKKKLSPKLPCRILPIQMPNCCQIGRLRPSFSRISAIWSEVALSPAMTAAGSPGVSRSMRKTKTATTESTGTMAIRRRAMKSSIDLSVQWLAAAFPSRPRFGRGRALVRVLRLFDVPHHSNRRLEPALDVGARGARPIPLAEPAILGGLDGARLDGDGQRLALGRVGFLGIGVAHLLHLGIGRPAEPGF